MEGSRLLDGWRGLLEGVGCQVNDQLKEALCGWQLLLGKQDQVTSPPADAAAGLKKLPLRDKTCALHVLSSS